MYVLIEDTFVPSILGVPSILDASILVGGVSTAIALTITDEVAETVLRSSILLDDGSRLVAPDDKYLFIALSPIVSILTVDIMVCAYHQRAIIQVCIVQGINAWDNGYLGAGDIYTVLHIATKKG